jgi:glucose-6-phosphate isomerase
MMQLVKDSGLNIYFDPEALHISFVDGPQGKFQRPEYSTRSFQALAPILEAPGCIAGQEQETVYWMFRNLGLQGNEHMVNAHGLRYDLSTFCQRLFGQELMKTSGHYHPAMWVGGPSYPELYEVAYGTAIFLMQEVDDISAGPDEVQVRDCIALECRQGEKAVMPPDFGHVTLNPDPHNTLITTNWVCSNFASVYGGAEICQGFAWYRTEDRGWVPNPHYKNPVPRLRFARCADVPELGLTTGQGIYPAGIANPELFAFVTRPQDFIERLWKGIRFEDPRDEAWKAEYVETFIRKHCKR